MIQFLTQNEYAEWLSSNLKLPIRSLDIAIYMINLTTDKTRPHRGLNIIIDRLLTIEPTLRPPRLILPSPETGNVPAHVNKTARTELGKTNWLIRYHPPGKTMHAKTWIFDDRRMIVGSHNLSTSSIENNIDTSIYTDEPHPVQQAVTWYSQLWAKSSRQGAQWER